MTGTAVIRGRARTWLLGGVALLAVFAAIAFAPLRTGDLKPAPAHPLDYASAIAAVSRRQRVDDSVAVPNGRSILLVHGRATATAVVLLHGYTNSPRQFSELANILFERGDNVYVPRLPHHAERTESEAALSRLTADDLRNASDSAVDVAHGLGDTVVVVGLSAGGTMAAWMAQYRPEVRRAVIIAPLLALARVPRVFATAVINAGLRLPNYSETSAPDPRERDRDLGWSTHAVAQSMRLGLAVRRAAGHQAPAVREIEILLNAHDRTIARQAVVALADEWARNGATVRITTLSDSLGLPHDVIDPRQPHGRPAAVYPVLLELIEGRGSGLVIRGSETLGRRP